MRYLALATDYDGTLAADGRVSKATARAIERLRISGRRAIPLTGRQRDGLVAAAPNVHLFDDVVAENGAVAGQRLRERGVEPTDKGKVMEAAWQLHGTAVLEVIQELGPELRMICHHAAIMVLPMGINKASALGHALRELGLSLHDVADVGDAANDRSFLERGERAVAVADAIPSIRQAAAFVTRGEAGDGVRQLVDALIAHDLRRSKSKRGRPGSGTSAYVAALIERPIERAYRVRIVDPEGDRGTLRDLATSGSARRAPTANEVLSPGRPEDRRRRQPFWAYLWRTGRTFSPSFGRISRPCAPAPAGRAGLCSTRPVARCLAHGARRRSRSRNGSARP